MKLTVPKMINFVQLMIYTKKFIQNQKKFFKKDKKQTEVCFLSFLCSYDMILKIIHKRIHLIITFKFYRKTFLVVCKTFFVFYVFRETCKLELRLS